MLNGITMPIIDNDIFIIQKAKKKMTLTEILIVLKFLKIDAELNDIKVCSVGYNNFYVYVKNRYEF